MEADDDSCGQMSKNKSSFPSVCQGSLKSSGLMSLCHQHLHPSQVPNPLAPGSDIQIHVSRGTRQGKPWMSTQLWLQNLSFLNYLDLRRTAIRLHHFGVTTIACLHPRNHKMANSLRTRDKATQTDAITCLCEQILLACNVGQQTKRKLIDFLLHMGLCTTSLLCPCSGISLARPTW